MYTVVGMHPKLVVLSSFWSSEKEKDQVSLLVAQYFAVDKPFFRWFMVGRLKFDQSVP